MEYPHQAPGDRQAESGCSQRGPCSIICGGRRWLRAGRFPVRPVNHSGCVPEGLRLQGRGGPRAKGSGMDSCAGCRECPTVGLGLWGKGAGRGPPGSPSPFSPSPCSAPELHTEQRRTRDTAPPEPGRQPWPPLGPCPGAASSRPARPPPCRRRRLPLGPRFPPGGRPQRAGPAPRASGPGPSSRSPRPAGRRRGAAWGARGEGRPAAAGRGAAASGPGAAGAPAGRSRGAGSAGAAPPGRAACRRAGAAGRAAAAREPAGREGVSEGPRANTLGRGRPPTGVATKPTGDGWGASEGREC